MSPIPPLQFTDHIFDFSFHPKEPILATGLINGQVHCADTHQFLWQTKVSKKSCRGVEFTQEGRHLLTISRDKSIQALDLLTGRILYKIAKAHRFPINKIKRLDTPLLATGDDEGIIKIWDMRTCRSVQEYQRQQDYISDMIFCETKSSLVAASGDGRLSIYDTRKSTESVCCTEEMEDEPLSLTSIRKGERIVAGSQSGALYFWDWNTWSGHTEWIGHPSSVDALVSLDQDTVCTGGSDGLLRLITVSPTQRFEGVLGDHGQDFPVEKIQASFDQRFLASSGHDLQLRFWEIDSLYRHTPTHPTTTHTPKRAKFFKDL